MRFRLVALVLAAAAFSACSYSAQRAHKLKEDQKVAALVQAATVDDRVRSSGEGAYEATYLAVFHKGSKHSVPEPEAGALRPRIGALLQHASSPKEQALDN